MRGMNALGISPGLVIEDDHGDDDDGRPEPSVVVEESQKENIGSVKIDTKFFVDMKIRNPGFIRIRNKTERQLLVHYRSLPVERKLKEADFQSGISPTDPKFAFKVLMAEFKKDTTYSSCTIPPFVRAAKAKYPYKDLYADGPILVTIQEYDGKEALDAFHCVHLRVVPGQRLTIINGNTVTAAALTAPPEM
ncbi:hypothetical protein Vafri_14556 [Volvox africanus]|nr:hypothetical protein Vafri_14556 [Volvox africanus]